MYDNAHQNSCLFTRYLIVPSAEPLTVNLGDGTQILDPLRLIRYMVLFEQNVYFRYDAVSVPPDTMLSVGEASTANAIGARRSQKELSAFVNSRAGVIAEALSKIDTDVSIEAPHSAIPWGELGALYSAALEPRIPGIKLSAATKILHKKRPLLLPILDDMVRSYLAATWGVSSEDALALTQAFKMEYDTANVSGALTALRNQLTDSNVALSPVRVLDKLLWARMLSNTAPGGMAHL